MDRNRLILIVALVAFIIVFSLLPAGSSIRYILAVLLIAVLCFTQRPTLYFARANKRYESDPKKAVGLYKKALKAGLAPRYAVMASNMLIQECETEEATKVLEKVVARSKDKEQVNLAKISLSMVAYIEKDYEKAAKLCYEARDNGCKERILFVNLATYCLALGRIEDFRSVVEDFSHLKVKAPVLFDLRAMLSILDGDYKAAYATLSPLMESGRTFTFPDIYVHYAQIMLHYGRQDEAVKALESCLNDVKFRPLSVIDKETVEAMLGEIKGDGWQVFAYSSEKDPLALINGKLPQLVEGRLEYENLDVAVQTLEAEESERREKEGEPNTELDEADEEWLRRHS